MSRNMVVAGNFEGSCIKLDAETPCFYNGDMGYRRLSCEYNGYDYALYVSSYEVITDEHTKSAMSGVARGLVGGALLGPVGLLAGAMSAKNKSVYTVAIQYVDTRDGALDKKRSLIEVDEAIYKAIVRVCFNNQNNIDNLIDTIEQARKEDKIKAAEVAARHAEFMASDEGKKYQKNYGAYINATRSIDSLNETLQIIIGASFIIAIICIVIGFITDSLVAYTISSIGFIVAVVSVIGSKLMDAANMQKYREHMNKDDGISGEE